MGLHMLYPWRKHTGSYNINALYSYSLLIFSLGSGITIRGKLVTLQVLANGEKKTSHEESKSHCLKVPNIEERCSLPETKSLAAEIISKVSVFSL